MIAAISRFSEGATASATFPIATAMIVLPILAAGAIALVPARRSDTHRLIAILSSLGVLALTLWVLVQFEPGAGFQFVDQQTWVRSLDIKFYVGVDGMYFTAVIVPQKADPAEHRGQAVIIGLAPRLAGMVMALGTLNPNA